MSDLGKCCNRLIIIISGIYLLITIGFLIEYTDDELTKDVFIIDGKREINYDYVIAFNVVNIIVCALTIALVDLKIKINYETTGGVCFVGLLHCILSVIGIITLYRNCEFMNSCMTGKTPLYTLLLIYIIGLFILCIGGIFVLIFLIYMWRTQTNTQIIPININNTTESSSPSKDQRTSDVIYPTHLPIQSTHSNVYELTNIDIEDTPKEIQPSPIENKTDDSSKNGNIDVHIISPTGNTKSYQSYT